MPDQLAQPVTKAAPSMSFSLRARSKARRPFAFLFEGLFTRGVKLYDIVRLGVLVCLAVSLFGVEVFISRGGGIFIGRRLANFGAILHYFNRYLWIPLTFVFAFLQIWRGLPIRRILKANIWSLSLAVYLVFRALYSEAPDIAEYRLDYFLNYVLPIVAFGVLLSDRVSMLYIRDTFFMFASLTVLAFVLSPGGILTVLRGESMGLMTTGFEERLVLQSDSITTGYTLGLYIVVAFMIFRLSVKKTRLEKYSIQALLGSLAFFLILNGTRGAIVATLLSGFVPMFFQRKKDLGRIAIVFSLIVIAGIFAVERIEKLYPTALGRYQFSSLGGNPRIAYFIESVTAPPTLFGRGIGSFGAISATEFRPIYTHNAFTEMYYEGGILGFLLFTIACGKAFRSIWRRAQLSGDSAAIFCLCGFIFHFVFTQFSGWLLGHQGFWLFLIAGPSYVALARKAPKR